MNDAEHFFCLQIGVEHFFCLQIGVGAVYRIWRILRHTFVNILRFNVIISYNSPRQHFKI